MKHEGFLHVLRFDRVDEAVRRRAAKRECREYVRFAAIENTGAVDDGRNPSCLRVERADFVHRATVDTLPFP